jgi:selenocysteine lyase/cysteine desulfurase
MLSERELAAYRQEFPVTRRQLYVNHAAVAPPSRRVRDAVHAWLADATENGLRHEPTWEEEAETARQRVAALLGAAPEEIAFVRSTGHGLSLVAGGLPWQAGERVAVATAVEYPSNIYAWESLRARGVEVVPLPAPRGTVDLEAAAPLLDERVRLVAVSSAQYGSGAVTDLDALGRLCAERGILLCVDGIQTLGALPVDVRRQNISFLAADSHKWLLGLCGIGVLYVAREQLERLQPLLVGWKSTVDCWNFDAPRLELRADAGRFEEGSPAYALIYGLGAAAGLLLEVGVERIAAHIEGLVRQLATGLAGAGFEVGPAPALRRHILTVRPPGGGGAGAVAALGEHLAAAGVNASTRRGAVRLSPHFYNTPEEMERLVAVARSFPG